MAAKKKKGEREGCRKKDASTIVAGTRMKQEDALQNGLSFHLNAGEATPRREHIGFSLVHHVCVRDGGIGEEQFQFSLSPWDRVSV